MTPRYEFRVFGDRLDAERDLLERLATGCGEAESRTDTYFVVHGRTDASLKVRGGKLDLKVLRARSDVLELWAPAAEAEFPVSPQTLRSELLEPAGVRIDLPDAPIERETLFGCVRAAPAARLAEVDKRRLRYRVGDVAAEHTRLCVDGTPFESIAIEEADRKRAIHAVAMLGLSARRNTSYQRFLVNRLFGTAASDRFGNAS